MQIGLCVFIVCQSEFVEVELSKKNRKVKLYSKTAKSSFQKRSSGRSERPAFISLFLCWFLYYIWSAGNEALSPTENCSIYNASVTVMAPSASISALVN